jgi:pyruvate kinase
MEEIRVGDGILIDDGEIELKVEAVDGDHLTCVVDQRGGAGEPERA